MQKTLISIALAAISLPVSFASAIAQASIEACRLSPEIVIAVEEEFIYPAGQADAASIQLEDRDSRVNIRTGPGTRFEADAYGLHGDLVWVQGQAMDAECETWLYVEFKESGHQGWIHGEFLEFAFARGIWD